MSSGVFARADERSEHDNVVLEPEYARGSHLWALEEVGQPYELRRTNIQAEHRDDPAHFLEASPLRKLPVTLPPETSPILG